MFTGIITDIGTIKAINGSELEIACHYQAHTIDIGASIACDGCCLTVTRREAAGKEGCHFFVDVSQETFSRTTLKDWQPESKINLERALKMGDEFGGHIVTGHVDGVATIKTRFEDGNSTRYQLMCPDELKRFIAPKGSVTLGGVSLTVNEVKDRLFGVNIIPHTCKNTCWQYLGEGDALNIEVDLLARYALRASEAGG